jgi:soluble lytic murein transglycosylase-like protein
MLINGVPFNCITQAAAQYHIPATMIVSVLKVEGGKVGTASKNKNGTIDYGPMQINSIWLKKIKPYGVSAHDLQYNPCVNINVGTWILAKKIANNKAVWKGVGGYHSKSYVPNLLYQYKVSIYYDFIKKALL